MLRKAMIALFTIASVGLLAPNVASARGGFGGGGGFHGGGFHHGFRRGFPLAAFAAGVGFGLADPYYYDYGYDPYYAAYDDSYYDDGGCYVVQRRIWTPYGWRFRPVKVCN